MAYGVWSMAYGVWSMAYGVWSMEYGVWRMACAILHTPWRSPSSALLQACWLTIPQRPHYERQMTA